MIKVLFVCHGNICRSPMAEYVMKDLVKKSNLSDQFHISSAATSTEEIGNPVHRGTRAKLAQAGIACEGHHARQMTRADYDGYDYLIGMDEWNIRNIKRITGGDPERGVLNPNHQKSRAHRLKMAALRYCQSYLYSLLAYRPQCCNK